MTDSFYRLCNQVFADNEEIKYELATNKVNAIEYIALAPVCASDSDSVWDIMRLEYSAAGLMTRRRFRSGIKWSERSSGWP